MYAHFKKKTTLASSYLLHDDLKERKVMGHMVYFILIHYFSDRDKVLIFREAIWRLKQWVFCLFHLKVLFGVISHCRVQHYFFISWQVSKAMDSV